MWKRDVPTTYEEAVTCDESKNWLTAMKREIHSMKDNNTWRLVERPKDCSVVGCKLIFKKKFGDEDVQYKPKLVAKGFSQKYGIDYGEVFSPVVSHTT